MARRKSAAMVAAAGIVLTVLTCVSLPFLSETQADATRRVSKCCLDASRKCTQCSDDCCPKRRDCCCRHADKCTCNPTRSQ